jgi:hypothetical protein
MCNALYPEGPPLRKLLEDNESFGGFSIIFSVN